MGRTTSIPPRTAFLKAVVRSVSRLSTPTLRSARPGTPASSHPTVFLGGQTYHVYVLYATGATKQSYDIYAPKSNLGELNVQSMQIDPNSNIVTPLKNGSAWATATYKDPILHVDVDLTGQKSAFDNSKKAFCRPKSYCEYNDKTGVCGCKSANGCQAQDCAWGPTDMDCPTDDNNPNVMKCFGFSFTMPAGYVAPSKPLPPDEVGIKFQLFTDGDSYFKPGYVKFANGKSISQEDACKYPPQ